MTQDIFNNVLSMLILHTLQKAGSSPTYQFLYMQAIREYMQNKPEWPRKLIDPFLKVLENISGRSIEDPEAKDSQELAVKAFQQVTSSANDKCILLPREVTWITSARKKSELKAIGYWGQPLEYLGTLIEISLEASSFFDAQVSPTIPTDRKHLRTVMWFLHSRACLVATEILCLLEHGYADGAHSRWRTLYEMATIASFITNPSIKGSGNDIAERYLRYQSVDDLKVIRTIGSNKKAIDELQSKVDDLCKPERFGRSFRRRNGWASDAFGDPDNPKFDASFDQIESKSGYCDKDLTKKARYKMASITIHAGAVGDSNCLGSIPDRSDIKVVGASPFGLEIPMVYTASDLTSITRHSMDVNPTWQGNAIIALMRVLTNSISSECIKSEKCLSIDLNRLKSDYQV